MMALFCRYSHWLLLGVTTFVVLIIYTADNSKQGHGPLIHTDDSSSKFVHPKKGVNGLNEAEDDVLEMYPPRLNENQVKRKGLSDWANEREERNPALIKRSQQLTASNTKFPPVSPQLLRRPKLVKSDPLSVGVGRNKTRLKTVLYWNEFYGRYDTYDFGYGHEAFVEKGCKVSSCFATADRTMLPVDKYDAIIIHIRGLPNDLPQKRSPGQNYIMLSIEAPIYLYEYRDLNAVGFNWTMTYRLDSDFPIPYAWLDNVKPLPAPLGSGDLRRYITKHGIESADREETNAAEGKLGLAVQFVSNCHSSSHREHYVRELQRYIPVDVYGKCGPFKCPKDRGAECYKMAEKKYKFYLSFEDAMCRDYATEKFFSIYTLKNVIPVVLGGANYSSLAPPHSYINAADFDSPKALAHYLKLLDANDAKFNEYFWWKPFYKRKFHHHQAFCDLCEKLHQEPKRSQSGIGNVHDWWVNHAHCTNAFPKDNIRDF